MKTMSHKEERAAKKRRRELEKQAKEMAKLSAMEQARLEVEAFENELDILLSIHKEQSASIDWPFIASLLPPLAPAKLSVRELKARQRMAISMDKKRHEMLVKQAQQDDEMEYQKCIQLYQSEIIEWEKVTQLAKRVLDGEHEAYIEAVHEFNPFEELSSIGSTMHITVHNSHMMECVLSTNGKKAIPAEFKSLTTAGKLSAKPMPRQRFIEIYQDYICSCVLRVAREIFALLPLRKLLITATVEMLDTSTGQMNETPFLSVAITREQIMTLNFDLLDPSDSIMALPHRGELKASRKSGEFESIIPLTSSIFPAEIKKDSDFDSVCAAAKRLIAELVACTDALKQKA